MGSSQGINHRATTHFFACCLRTHLQIADQDRIESRSRDHSKFSLEWNFSSELPVRDTDPHAALDDTGQLIARAYSNERCQETKFHFEIGILLAVNVDGFVWMLSCEFFSWKEIYARNLFRAKPKASRSRSTSVLVCFMRQSLVRPRTLTTPLKSMAKFAFTTINEIWWQGFHLFRSSSSRHLLARSSFFFHEEELFVVVYKNNS